MAGRGAGRPRLRRCGRPRSGLGCRRGQVPLVLRCHHRGGGRLAASPLGDGEAGAGRRTQGPGVAGRRLGAVLGGRREGSGAVGHVRVGTAAGRRLRRRVGLGEFRPRQPAHRISQCPWNLQCRTVGFRNDGVVDGVYGGSPDHRRRRAGPGGGGATDHRRHRVDPVGPLPPLRMDPTTGPVLDHYRELAQQRYGQCVTAAESVWETWEAGS